MIKLSCLTRAALVLVVALSACRAPDQLPAPRASSQAPRAGRDPLDIALPPLAWEASPARIGGRRVALIVAVDEYAEPNWNLPFARPSAALLVEALTESGAFAPEDVVVKSGDRATPDSISAQIERWGREFEGPDNALVVYWLGHGFNIDGEQQFLTWASRHDGSTYAHTVPYGSLALWINDTQREVRERGGELSTALVVDACRTRDQNAPGTLRAHRALVDVEAFSAAPGSPATAHATRDVTVFADAFAQALERQGLSRDLSLLAALETSVAAAASQGALITTGDRDLTLLDADDLSVAVRAVDADTGKPIPGATVQLNGEERSGTAVFRELAETAEGYDLLVRAPGYFWRAHTLDLDRARSGALVSVPLRPEFVVLQGRVEIHGRGVARVAVSGEFEGLRDDEHITSQTLTSSGGFRLRVPPTPGPRSLVVELDGAEVRRVAFDLAELPSTLMASAEMQVRVHDLGVHVLEAGSGTSALAGSAVAAQVGGVDLSFSFPAFSERDFTDAPSWAFFSEVRELVESGDYVQAARDLEALEANERVRSTSRRKLEDLREEVQLAELLRRADRAQARGDLAAARDLLDASALRDHPKVEPLLLSWFAVAAREAREAGQLDEAAAQLEKAMEFADSREKRELRGQLQAVRTEALELGFAEALRTGEAAPLEPLVEALRAAGGYTEARVWRTRIEREVIPPECRRHYEAGVAAQSDGELVRAHDDYGRALASDPNAHYEELLGELRRELGQRLFQRFNATASEHYSSGERRRALEAYLDALRYDTLVVSRIARLVADEELRVEAPELVARAEAALAVAARDD